jgi:acetyl-CoA C-acetyltransferase
MSEAVIVSIGRTPIGRAVKGSLITLGHPFGMTGVRILATLLNDLRTRDQAIGLETMCVGGSQGMAMIIERLS